MKKVTHAFGGLIAFATGILLLPPVQGLLKTYAGKDPRLMVIIPAVLSLVALYHNPKDQPKS